MLKTAILSILLLSAVILANMGKDPLPKVTSGKIERIVDFSSVYVLPRNIDIWLPEGYSIKNKYPVLYMHDGQMLFDSSITWNKQEWGVDETMTGLIKKEKITAAIVVGIWNSGPVRRSEYFPQKAFHLLTGYFRDSLLTKGERYGAPLFTGRIYSDDYLKFIVEELKPYIDKNYSTLPGKEHTFIAGSSMGGLISLYAICEYPEIFSGAACLSTHWPGANADPENRIPKAFAKYMYKNLPPPEGHKIYFDFGTETLDSLYEPLQNMADNVMANKGYTIDNWFTRKFPGADHSENAWRKRFHIPAIFLLQKK